MASETHRKLLKLWAWEGARVSHGAEGCERADEGKGERVGSRGRGVSLSLEHLISFKQSKRSEVNNLLWPDSVCVVYYTTPPSLKCREIVSEMVSGEPDFSIE